MSIFIGKCNYSLFGNQKKQYLFYAEAGIFFSQQMLPKLSDVIYTIT